MGLRGTARSGARQEGRVDLRRPGRAGGRRADYPGRQGLPGLRVREDPVPGTEQAGIPERGQPRPRETPLTWRARERPAQNLAHPPQAPLLPLARRTTRQGHSRIAGPRGIARMEKVHYRVDPGDFHRECLLAPAIVLHGGGAVNREDSLAASDTIILTAPQRSSGFPGYSSELQPMTSASRAGSSAS